MPRPPGPYEIAGHNWLVFDLVEPTRRSSWCADSSMESKLRFSSELMDIPWMYISESECTIAELTNKSRRGIVARLISRTKFLEAHSFEVHGSYSVGY
jgi:hypothetical protein